MKTLAFRNSGVTMVEMAIVLVIIGLLLGGLLMPLSAQMEQRRVSETQATLAQIQEALIGFAIANGRLPCPATATSAGRESFCTNATGGCGVPIVPNPPAIPIPTHGRCSAAWTGFVPAATLGITPIDAGGYAIDGWQIPQNRIRYAVTNSNTNAFTAVDPTLNMKAIVNGSVPPSLANLTPDLSVCATATGITPLVCNTAPILINNAVAVIHSVGRNNTAIGADQAANRNNNRVFVSHPPTPATAPNGEFDDIVVWISPNVLYNRMVAAGMLP